MSIAAALLAGALNLGFYSGQAILYPYDPVYCDKDGGGLCYGVYIYTPKSAPLPPTEKHCEWADLDLPGPKNWFQWEPRTVSAERQKYLGQRVCYLEDRGPPRDINDLEK